MRNRWLLWVAVFVVTLCAAQPPLWSGTTGKIAGTVIDKATNEPLPGVNIVVDGTTLGAITDIDGNYTVLYVPPGIFSIRVSMIGYAKISVTDIRVLIDQTARVNVALESEVLEVKGMVVVAEKHVIKQDVATSMASISSQEVQELPMNTMRELAGLQAGVQEGLVIRGGSADEALFQVDGITLRDPRNNKPITGIALSAIQEVSIERGGFNAEYGQVRSGLINVVTKEGSKTGYSGSATVKVSPPGAKNFGLSPYDQNSMWLRPYLDDAVCWTGTKNGAWDKYTQQQYPTFDGWNKISQNLLNDDIPTNDLTPMAAKRLFEYQHRRRPVTDQPDYNIDAGFGGPVPFLSEKLGGLRFFTSYRSEREMLLIPLSRPDYKDYDWSLRLTSDINPNMKLKFTGLMGKSYNVAINTSDVSFYTTDFGIIAVPAPFWNSSDYVRTPLEIAHMTNEQRSGRIFTDSWYCPSTVNYYTLAAQWTHIISPKTFYEVNVEHFGRKYETGPIRDRDNTPSYELLPGFFVDEAPFGFDPAPETGIGDPGFFFGGHTSTVRDSSRVWTTSLRADLTSQINFANLVKAGIEIAYSNLDLRYDQLNFFVGGRNSVRQKDDPIRGAIYIQDKLEAKGFILSGGLRLDYTNSNTEWIDVGVFDRGYYSTDYKPTLQYSMKKTKGQWSLSPRLSISHPITENSKLFFNYGHFKQLPTYEQMFRVGRGNTGQASNIGDPNLILAKTISYELGYDQALFNNYLIQLAAYYHDIQDQQTYIKYISSDSRANYTKATNQSYADIRGFELTLRKNTGRWLTAFANYTYEVTTSGIFGYTFVYESIPMQVDWFRQNRGNLQQQRPQPAPYARVNLSLHTPSGFGPEWIGMKPLQDWAMTLIGDWRSGGYFTWNENNLPGILQNVQLTDFTNFTLRLNKTLDLKKFKVTFFMEVENLFNTKYLSGAGFYDALDQTAYLQSLHLPMSKAYKNIVGSDKIGDYRKCTEFQPMSQFQSIDAFQGTPDPLVIYYEISSKHYLQYSVVNNTWGEVDKGRINKVLDDKAYIDMPNQTSFNFLNPRQIFFGIRTSFDLR